MAWVERQARASSEIIDPLTDTLARIGRDAEPAEELLGLRQIFPARLATDTRFRSAVLAAAARIRHEGALACLEVETLDA
jgi:fructuronate reductase